MTPEDHFRHLAEFIRGVELAGGTTPHVAMTVESMRRLNSTEEKLWFAGCYALTYNWPAAERLFLELRLDDVANGDFIELLMWLEEHWAGIPLRKERKAVFRKSFFAESALAYARLAERMLDELWPETYSEAFHVFNQGTRYMGRYIAIRWLEVMRRAFPDECGLWVMPSILADGGEHPRKALALIYPEDAPALLGGNRLADLKVADAAADRLLLDLLTEYDIRTSFYEIQSLLCEYKQSALGRKQYPGKSIDTEMDYLRRCQQHWGVKYTTFWEVRYNCFPGWALGEIQDRWWGVRPVLNRVLADYGYTWSDAVYDYNLTTDFSNPVLLHSPMGQKEAE